MPSIDTAMVRSLGTRRSVFDVVAAAMQPVIYGRGVQEVQDKITDVKTAFSSWDNCMHADFCKWPVIGVIIIGGLIIISIVWCIVRCACCGLSCCCECCYCLKCCGNCLGCCDPPRNKKNKYLDEPYIPPHQGYRSEAPMAAGALATSAPYKAPLPAATVQDKPQYANFDVSKSAGHEDALPAMPSWENASSKKVYLEEDVEMDDLKKPDNTAQAAPLLNANSNSPGPTSPSPMNSPNPTGSMSPAQPSPVNNLGPGGHPAVANGYLAAGTIPIAAGSTPVSAPYGRNSPGYSMPQQMGATDYDQPDRANDYVYAASAMGPGRQSPNQYNNSQQSGYGANMPPARQPGYGANMSPQQQQQQQQQPGGGGYGRNDEGGNYYGDYHRNGNGTPQGYDLDNRSPRIPDIAMSGRNSPAVGYGPNGSGGPGRYGSPAPGPNGPGRYGSPAPGPNGPGRYGSPGPGPSGPGRYGSPKPGGPNYPSSTNGRPMNGRPMNGRPPPQRQYTGSTMVDDGNSSGYPSSINNSMNNSMSNMNSGMNTSMNNNAMTNGSNNGGGGYEIAEMPASPTLQNNAGFDFSSGYSRPPTRGQEEYGGTSNNHGNAANYNGGYSSAGGYDTGSNHPMSHSTSPPPLAQPQQDTAAYSSYRSYRG